MAWHCITRVRVKRERMSRPDHGDAIPALLVRLLTDPKYRPALAIVKGVRNGIVYGCKIRFPHALVMTLLFKSGR